MSKIVISSSLSSKYFFLISLEIFFLHPMLLRIVLFNLKVFKDFPGLFLLLISSLSPLCSEKEHYRIFIVLMC